MTSRFAVALAVCVLAVTAAYAQCVSLIPGTYTQDFNSLASSGTSSAVPAGWSFSETGTNANTTYTAGTGGGSSAQQSATVAVPKSQK